MTDADGEPGAATEETEHLRPEPLQPHSSRLAVTNPMRTEILARHDSAVRAGEQGYPDPATGLFVLTAQVHIDRGHCCGNGCRHCPYVGA